MTTLKHIALMFILTFCSATWSIAQTQLLALDVAIDSDQVRFAAAGQEMRVEIFSPSGEIVFDSGAVTGQPVDWKMQNAKGERVADGVYLVTISLRTATGQVRKRIEQVVIGREQQAGAQQSPNAPSATITGTGTTGKIAKFTGAATIGDSVMTESSGKIGIGINTPTAFFHVKGAGGTTAIVGNNTGTGIGINGISVSSYGVSGKSTSDSGVYGATAGAGADAGVFGISIGKGGNGVIGEANNGQSAYGVWGKSTTGYGVVGYGGIYGFNGVGNTAGVRGFSVSGAGVNGVSSNGSGVYGQNNTHSAGAGVYGISYAENGRGVIAVADIGGAARGVWGISSEGYAGFFSGDVYVGGTLSKTGGSFKIDHPLDPANKYLYHSFVESPDMMNIYNGNVTTDANGEATIALPKYCQALNRDFRYQLTVIGEFAQAIVSQEIKGNRFQIRTDKPQVKVSWQVTGIRRDAWAEAHRIPVEESKPEKERGFYLYPELYGQPAEQSVEWAQHPEMMKKMKEEREARQQPQPPPPSVKQ